MNGRGVLGRRALVSFLTVGVVALAGLAGTGVPGAAASASSWCEGIGGSWNGRYCHTSVRSDRNALRDIKIAIPNEVIDDPAMGPTVRDYLGTLVENWRAAGKRMAADSFGEATYQILRHPGVLSLVYRETYHADGPDFNNAYRTFTFDTSSGARLQLADLTRPGVDPLAAIPPLAHPYVVAALDAAQPPHPSSSYPFVANRWTPDMVYSGGYRAWALTSDELIIYMPDYPVARDSPIDFTPGVMQWSMDGGTVQVHVPLDALAPVLRSEFGGAP